RHHPTLLPFPTRRSSDLQTHSGDTDPVAGSILLVDDGQYASGRQSTLIRFGRSGDIETLREGVIEDRFIRKQLRMNIVFVCTGKDRKSTRLNSSHVKISY